MEATWKPRVDRCVGRPPAPRSAFSRAARVLSVHEECAKSVAVITPWDNPAPKRDVPSQRTQTAPGIAALERGCEAALQAEQWVDHHAAPSPPSERERRARRAHLDRSCCKPRQR
ncbi:unnamed protein product [Lampetra fluviatilis]